MDTSASPVDLEALLGKLTLEEKVSILAATDWWRTPVIKRDDVFVPHIKVRPAMLVVKVAFLTHHLCAC